MPHADNRDPLYRLAGILLLSFLICLIRKIGNQFFQVSFRCDPIYGHDLHHPAIQLAVPYVTRREGLDLKG